MTEPSAILLLATRQIGDVLLATPLLRSLRRAYPRARIDVLVFTGHGGVLEGNPDCDEVIAVDEHPAPREYLKLVRRILRRYDLAVTTQQSDRSHIYAWLAAPRRVGLVTERRAHSWWKRAAAESYEVLDNLSTHTVVQNLRLADRLGIGRCYEVVPPAPPRQQAVRARPYAVVHPFPMWHYKRWTALGWQRLMESLRASGLEVLITGGPGAEERAFCAALAGEAGAASLAGELSFGELAALLRGARLYVGPDTAVTHLAASCGTPTLALYGPSNPVKWGPWPAGARDDPSPWQMLGRPWQRKGNVLLLQGVQPADLGACLPCREEGCERHKTSSSRCLTELPPDPVIAAARSLLSAAA